MYQLEKILQEGVRGLHSSLVEWLTISGLNSLKIPGAIVIPEQLVDSHKGVGDPELGIIVLHLSHCLIELILEPLDSKGVNFTLLK